MDPVGSGRKDVAGPFDTDPVGQPRLMTAKIRGFSSFRPSATSKATMVIAVAAAQRSGRVRHTQDALVAREGEAVGPLDQVCGD